MKNTRVLLITALAIIFGLAAGYSALRYLNTRPEVVQVAADNETVSAVLAARDLPLGKSLEDEDLRLIEWPAQALPLGVARTKEEVIGQSLITDVRANEVSPGDYDWPLYAEEEDITTLIPLHPWPRGLNQPAFCFNPDGGTPNVGATWGQVKSLYQ